MSIPEFLKHKNFDSVELLNTSGGMGEIYRCIQSDKFTVIKCIKEELTDPDFIKRFKREIRIIKGLDHPNIIKIFDYNYDSIPLWYEMEFAPNQDLNHIIKDMKDDTNRIIKVFLEICEGLNYIHTLENPVVHRDLKPQNILMFDNDHAKITDMGLSKFMNRDTPPITLTGYGGGTLKYMPPEQFHDFKYVDFRSDIYSLGVILFEMFTDSNSFIGINFDEVLQRPFNNIVRKMLSQNPSERYQTVEELMEDIKTKEKLYQSMISYNDPEVEIDKIMEIINRSMDKKPLIELIKIFEDNKDNPDFVWEKIDSIPKDIILNISNYYPDSLYALVNFYKEAVERVGVIPFPFNLMNTWTDFFEFIYRNCTNDNIKKLCLGKIIFYAIRMNQFYSMNRLSQILIDLKDDENINMLMDVTDEQDVREDIASLMEDKDINPKLKVYLFSKI